MSDARCATCSYNHPPPEGVIDHALACFACAGERAAFAALYSDIADLQRHRDYQAIDVVLTTASRLTLDLLIGLLTATHPSREHLQGYAEARMIAMRKALAAGTSSTEVARLMRGL